MKTIDITIDEQGLVTIETKGYKGKTCKQATEALEKELGITKACQLKPEYYQSEDARIKQGVK